MNLSDLTEDEQAELIERANSEGRYAARRALHRRLEEAQRASEQRLIDAKAARDKANPSDQVRASTLSPGSTAATVTIGGRSGGGYRR